LAAVPWRVCLTQTVAAIPDNMVSAIMQRNWEALLRLKADQLVMVVTPDALLARRKESFSKCRHVWACGNRACECACACACVCAWCVCMWAFQLGHVR
jgi:hypothetical protein